MITPTKIFRFVIRWFSLSSFVFFLLNSTKLEAKTFTVSNTNDSGPGSFRQALLDANAHPGKDKIEFDIPGSGPHTLRPLSGLPTITDRVVIDGYSQPGAKPNRNSIRRHINARLKIELDGSNLAGVEGLIITAGNCTVRGLVINSFKHAIILETKGGNKIEGNYIGTDVSGGNSKGNDFGIQIGKGSSQNTIGGRKKASRNLISGNLDYGININGNGTSGNAVQGNFIGTDVTGTQDLGNGTWGVLIQFGGTNTLVGGTKTNARNLISGNEFDGVKIFENGATGNLVQGNYIGTDVTGKKNLSNSRHGVYIQRAPNNTIGGTKKGAGNVISGNGVGSAGNGVFVDGSEASGNVLQGNFIGLDVTGKKALGNKRNGLVINLASNTTVGGTKKRAGNIISANGRFGIFLGSNNNIIQGNYIGTDAKGKKQFGNVREGIGISAVSGNLIGGQEKRAGNVIAFNQSPGLLLVAGSARNRISRNSIFSNNGLAIDLGPANFADGVTPNDPGDGDSGPNNLQNFPVLTSAVIDNGKTKVAGTIDTPDPEDVTIEFFANKNSDPSGHGEGEKFLGTTKPNNLGEFDVKLPKVKSGAFISATATDKDGNTSEFSENIEALKPEQLPKSAVVTEGETQAIPESFGLSHNYPNPFNPETKIEFRLPEASHVIVKIYNTLGQEIRTLIDSPYQAGFHRVGWDGMDNRGNRVASGVYLYRLQVGEFSQVRKMSLLR